MNMGCGASTQTNIQTQQEKTIAPLKKKKASLHGESTTKIDGNIEGIPGTQTIVKQKDDINGDDLKKSSMKRSVRRFSSVPQDEKAGLFFGVIDAIISFFVFLCIHFEMDMIQWIPFCFLFFVFFFL